MQRIIFYALVMFLIQGIYLFVAGLWPLLHLESFLRATQLETDTWLMRFTGVFMLSVSLCMLLSYYMQKYSLPVNVMAVMICLGCLYMDSYYYFRADLPLQVYLFDFFAQTLFAISWLTILLRYLGWRSSQRSALNNKLKT